MSKWAKIALAGAVVAGTAAWAGEGKLGLGRKALPEEIAAWDKTVLPDGTGLPPGSGDVSTGDQVFSERCASCHGDFAEGIDNWPVLAGGMGTLTNRRPVKTIGSYWPHVSTVWDYIHRSMPFGQAQTVSVDDTYAIVAFLLYSNGIVDEDFTLSNENFTSIKMPNAGGFRADDRPQTEYPEFSKEPCMKDCMAPVKVTKRAVTLNVTPMDADGKPAGTLPNVTLQHAAASGSSEKAAADASNGDTAGAETAADDTASQKTSSETAVPDAALVSAGEKVFRRCKSCHKIGPGARNASGPELNGIVGREIASVDGFKYSSAMTQFGEGGKYWDHDTLAAFLAAPRKVVKGTRMSFAGLRQPEEIEAIIAYLSTFPAE